MRTYRTREEILKDILKDIPGYEGQYAITEDGKVWSYKQNKFMSTADGNNGYQQINLCTEGKQKNMYIHRLVAMTYLPNPENLPEINHKDENKANNHVSNLEWCDRQYNLQYSDVCNRTRKVYCEELDMTFDSIKEASAYTGVDRGNITVCCRGRLKTAGKYHWRYVA